MAKVPKVCVWIKEGSVDPLAYVDWAVEFVSKKRDADLVVDVTPYPKRADYMVYKVTQRDLATGRIHPSNVKKLFVRKRL